MTVETPSQTVYINNLNEKVKIPALKQALAAMFAQFGEIIDVVAYKNLRSRGQAWVVFKDMSSAAHAIDAMQGFEFYDKPMRIQFAKSKSDAVAKQEGTFEKRARLPKGEKHKRLRAKEGGPQLVPQAQAIAGAMAPSAVPAMGGMAGMMPPSMAYPYMQGPPSGMAGMPGQAQQQQPPHQMPAYMQGPPPQGPPPGMLPQGAPQGPPPGYGAPQPQGIPQGPPPGMVGAPYMQQRPSLPAENPPNHILLLTGLPEQTTDQMLYQLFGQVAGLREVRVIPGRHDIAFVEYGTEDQAADAKNKYDGFRITPTDTMKVQFAKKGAA